jgi:hypothetical protein
MQIAIEDDGSQLNVMMERIADEDAAVTLWQEDEAEQVRRREQHTDRHDTAARPALRQREESRMFGVSTRSGFHRSRDDSV